MCVNFNDCLTGGQLHYDWDKITVTWLNESHYNGRNISIVYTGHTATLIAVLAAHA